MTNTLQNAKATYEAYLRSTLLRFEHPLVRGSFGVDFYGVPKLQRTLAKLPDARDVVIVMFLDALVAYLNRLGPRLFEPADRPIWQLNGHNVLTTPKANFTRETPQVLIGLHTDWTDDDLTQLEEATRDELVARAPADSEERKRAVAVLREAAESPHLAERVFRPFDFHLWPDRDRNPYLAGMTAAAAVLES